MSADEMRKTASSGVVDGVGCRYPFGLIWKGREVGAHAWQPGNVGGHGRNTCLVFVEGEREDGRDPFWAYCSPEEVRGNLEFGGTQTVENITGETAHRRTEKAMILGFSKTEVEDSWGNSLIWILP